MLCLNELIGLTVTDLEEIFKYIILFILFCVFGWNEFKILSHKFNDIKDILDK